MSTPRATTLTRIQLAVKLGEKPRTITSWLEEGLPVARRGKAGRPSRYSEADVRAWMRERDAAVAARATKTGGAFADSRSRKELAQAVESELRVAIRLGQLLPVEVVDDTWSRQVTAVRSRLLAIPMALADRLHRAAVTDGAAGVEALLQTAIYQTLTELASNAAPTKPHTKRKPPAKRKRSTPKTRSGKA